MAVTSTLLSVAEFARLPQPDGGVRQELHHGEVVELPPVKKLHTKLQKRLVSLLESAHGLGEYGVDKEFPFRPASEYEVWIADVALFSQAIWAQTPDDDYFGGVPAIVIEVLSPSTRRIDMTEKQEAYFAIPSLMVYLLVEQDSASITIHRRTPRGFVAEVYSGLEAIVPLPEISIELPLADVYERVEFAAVPGATF